MSSSVLGGDLKGARELDSSERAIRVGKDVGWLWDIAGDCVIHEACPDRLDDSGTPVPLEMDACQKCGTRIPCATRGMAVASMRRRSTRG